MPKGIGTNIWLRHVAVALGYALAYTLLRHVSFSFWLIFAGCRLGVLLFVPYRYWPALAIGECLALVPHGMACAPEYGWLWGVGYMLPPILFAMPVVRWCRERRRMFPSRNATNINVFLSCTLAVSAIWTAVNMVTFSVMQWPAGAFHYQLRSVVGWYFLGNYIGILTLVPLILFVREELPIADLRQLWAKFSESRLVMDSAFLLVPALVLLVWLVRGASGDVSREARVAMFLPVAWLALRHGWRGAALGGTAASIAVVLTVTGVRDTDTVQALVFIAFTITTMLMLGGRIALLHEGEMREKTDARLALAMAQRNVFMGEMQLRQTSYALEQVSGAIQASYTQLVGRLRGLLPGLDERTYYRQAALTQHQMYRLADSLYPLAWRERGLLAALREGSMPRALDEAGIVYWCDVRDGKLDELPTSVHITLYRLACEAVALACSKRNISHIHVRLRGGSFGGRRWVALCADTRVEYERLSRVRWDDLASALGGSGLGLGAIKDRAAIFRGKVRARSLPGGERLSLMLFEPDLL
ncbi:Signal transduction histidine kinase, glucose-6-phosphate specific [Frateuria terrea]|uniref:Signal transduction histidine kinase, glucose-6-phosphate specific n=1 Tax=Frateuria terrea TaxID=529704 RepID=A0A1H6UGB1_9GAMM|nr:Signal transduction histidine kinase, glucose-6-phosphate specific [Frateuria terrea]SFP38622.1 Signal transduction histidine kinase, glucose-6-phosphate specific [Frateuria terrea]